MADDHAENPDPATPAGGNGPNAAGAEAEEGESPQIRDARNAVERAKEELRRAQEVYADIRQEATQQLKRVREQTVGELVETGLRLVRKHPGPGVVLAAVLGFFLGRLFRR